MPIVTSKQLNSLFHRQEKVEKELDLLKKVVLMDDERFIRSDILKKWERVSHNLDKKEGRSFTSIAEMKKWLTNL
ncbi:MAG: hypothetical protein A3J55_01280 [Candidatus Ryanbacteria bacterium RIFCSPHIGHO2_02_FULL_45_17b]|uniref:Uncharacterized protein n=1 Tax=Candidatus Ryanbacteria bacterium RIFCSPHIGHO2_01_FULL_45_22 TaxID=1802114 RepID=A0A1G2G150_9BACT|nr:MAG: hypothetical protein A2719_03750 [Candidatus Ryanbacteria bacterium RIFCSPHIGHO2_01_FULL_45_22]OGZ47166.1 MAG: hypothetical protein A3J55_01280 [Candidatus Ryanbacteria bacterium RIFCSPHIGHO2_02_FULL_45_17b]